MGVQIDGPHDGRVTIHGVGMHGLKPPSAPLDLGNSGTSMRLMCGLLARQGMDVTLVGDASLSRRPMKRVTEPLARMGAKIDSAEGGTAPLHINAVDTLDALHYDMPVASAQVKSCLLLAGMYAQGETCDRAGADARPYRAHAAGLRRVQRGSRACLSGGGSLQACDIDGRRISPSAAFFLVGASIAQGSDLLLEHVGMNPTRDGVINILRLMGADIGCSMRVWSAASRWPICVRSAPLKGYPYPAGPGAAGDR